MNTLDSFRLDGQVAVVVGGARDLGYDIAEALGDAGSDMVITSRRLEAAEAAAEKLRTACNVDVLPLALDHCQHEQVAAVAHEANNWKGRVHVLVNNAGGSVPGRTPFLERPPESIAAAITLNLTGPLYCCQEFGRRMGKTGGGSIINIASIAGMVGRNRKMYHRTGLNEQSVDYCAAKAGVIGMTMDLAAYMAPMGIRVNAISPGGFERGQPQAFIDAYSERTPLGRMGKDGVDLKGAALYLASAASAYVTGQNLLVDGGFVMWH